MCREEKRRQSLRGLGREGRRETIGIPRTRWDNYVKASLRIIGSDIEKAKGRREWWRIFGEANDQLGFQCPQE